MISHQPEPSTSLSPLPSSIEYSSSVATLLLTRDSTTAGGSRSVTSPGPVFSETKRAPTIRSLPSEHLLQEPTLQLATTMAKSTSMEVTVVLTIRESPTTMSTLSTLKLKPGQNTTQLLPNHLFLKVVVATHYSLLMTNSTHMVAGTQRPNTTMLLFST